MRRKYSSNLGNFYFPNRSDPQTAAAMVLRARYNIIAATATIKAPKIQNINPESEEAGSVPATIVAVLAAGIGKPGAILADVP